MQNSETARRKQLLSQAYQQQLGVVSDQSVKEVRYNILKKEVDANRDIYQSMLQRVKEASIVAALKSSDVRVVSPATRGQIDLPPEFAAEPGIGIALRYCLHRLATSCCASATMPACGHLARASSTSTCLNWL